MQQNLEEMIRHALNSHSAENGSDTPDFILAQYLLACLETWNVSVKAREKWYARVPKCGGSGPVPIDPST